MVSASPPPADLAISARGLADCRLVEARGRVDHTNAARFLDALSAEAARLPDGGGFVIDLSGLSFITSAGLRALMQTKSLIGGRGGRLVVAGALGTVAEVIRIARFGMLLTLAPTPREGLALLSPEAAALYDS